MSIEMPFSKENLDAIFKELGKTFRKLNGTSMSAEIILVGGASILANYGFRDITYDIDAVIIASSAMKEAINRVGDKFGLPYRWLNMDFSKSKSYSQKLVEFSVYYKTFSNILIVRSVAAEYLIAMKLMSGRQYKNDLSDVIGILCEHEKSGRPISREAIDNAVIALYNYPLPKESLKFISDAYLSGDVGRLYHEIKGNEQQAKEILLDFEKDYPKTLTEDNTALILEKAKQKRK
ncbi:MAG: DUF6036 family nucleotidyltransferase [Lachnospiraceae bacterium]|nr:DUF6036 family nucleotidyltransferase [Lachnospiraceae bacterium]